ncbi:helix-turn-helix domain-containing protein [Algoriphagus namhaensis]
METQSTDRLELAARFVNNTHAPIFLTGKAGTGKTTFLRDLARSTHKSHVIVAPTGIAALNAGGVTIHSQFQLPLGFFLPVREPEGNFSNQYGCFTQHTLTRKHPIGSLRRSVLKSIDLLVIDEVSMLRADVLDAIDFRLRSIKRNYQQPFGGVQVLMIGDLYQLPPIVKDQEWSVLRQFYHSIHFFESKVLSESGMIYLELDKIFRQQDGRFISLLNNLRDNAVTQEDVSLLNSHFKTPTEIQDIRDCITLTTHNYKADQINRERLDAIQKPSFFYAAEVTGDFPESLYPLPASLELREGAQVMFIKNDSSGSADYFNGKLAQVESLTQDEITVRLEGSNAVFTLRKELWENKKYVIDENTKELEEEVIGTFAHFPIKLAWAVTVHKSQGLTFDRAVIDVGRAFAPGQVYVALSRLRSLDGLILQSKIQPEALLSDPHVEQFSKEAKAQGKLEELLQSNEQAYVHQLLNTVFSLDTLRLDVDSFLKKSADSMEFEDPEMQQAMPGLVKALAEQAGIAQRFTQQLRSLLVKGDFKLLQERLDKGAVYFLEFLEKTLERLLIHLAEVSRFSRVKTYTSGLEELEVALLKKYEDINQIQLIVAAILQGKKPEKSNALRDQKNQLRIRLRDKAKALAEENPKFATNKTGRKKKGSPSLKRKVGETYEITFAMIDEGKSIGDIVVERGLAESTIKSHLARGIREGKVELEDCLPQETIFAIRSAMEEGLSPQQLRERFDDQFDYNTIRMVMAAGRSE